MPSVLAAQRDRRLAEEMAEAIVSHAEEDQGRRGVRQVLQSSGSRPSRPTPLNDNENCYQNSVGLASWLRSFTLDWYLVNYPHSKTTDGTSWTRPRTRNNCGAQVKRPFKLCGELQRSSGTISSSTYPTTSTWDCR